MIASLQNAKYIFSSETRKWRIAYLESREFIRIVVRRTYNIHIDHSKTNPVKEDIIHLTG